MLTEELFPLAVTEPEVIELKGAELLLYKHFFNKADSDYYFKQLLKEINWQQGKVRLYGKLYDEPRLSAWYGDKNKSYTYSGVIRHAISWMPILLDIKQRVEQVSDSVFNSVLVNLYRDEQDSVSWHSDDEPELGVNPVIASISLGECRTFSLRHKNNKKDKYSLGLPNGSLLLMRGTTQHHWQHQIAKVSSKTDRRINLTFREIISSL